MTRSKRERGATLIDILAGLAILTVALGVAIPNFGAMIVPYRLTTASRVLASDLAVARMRAIAQNRRVRVNFDEASGTYQLEPEITPGNFQVTGARRNLPDGLSFGDLGNDPIFDSRGILSNDLTIPILSSGGQRTVTCNVLGQTTIAHN